MNFPAFPPAVLTSRELFDSAIVALSTSRADGTWLAVNQACARLLGFESPEALMRELPNDAGLYADPAERDRLIVRVASEGSVSDFEARIRRRDGTLRWISIGMQAIHGAHGELVALHAALFDVTEKRAARERAQLEEQRLRKLLELLPLSVSMSDEKGDLVLGGGSLDAVWSGKLPRGRERFARYRGRWADTGRPLQPEEWPVVRALERGETRANDEIEIDALDGGTKIIRSWATPLRDAEGRVAGVVAVNEDITQRKRDELRLRLEHGVALRLQEAESAAAGLQAVIRHICETEGWLGGRYWRVDAAAGVARFDAAWGPAGSAIEQYNEESRAREFRRGEGYVGRAWQSGEPLWVADVQKDGGALRAVIGRDVPKRSTFLIPVVAQGRVIGILAFDSAHVRAADPRLLQAARIIGAQVGQFVRRKESEASVRRSEALNRGILDASVDGIVTIDADGRLVEFNAAAERLSGWGRDEALGRDMAELIIPAHLRERHRAGLRKLLRTGESELLGRRTEVPALRRDGSTFDAELSIVRIPGQQPMFTGTLRDITARKREEALSRLQYDVTLRFAQETDAGPALRAAIQAICETEGWEAGRYLGVDAERNELRDAAAWCIDAPAIRQYIEESRAQAYAPGEGLVGHVWQTGVPLWVPDIAADPRVRRPDRAATTGMRSSVVFPVHAEGRTLGVFIFDSREIRRPDERLLRTLGVIGGQVGLLVRRAQAQAALRESESRFRGLVELSTDWYWEQDEELRFTRFGGPAGEAARAIGKRRWEIDSIQLLNGTWDEHRALLEARKPFRGLETKRESPGGAYYVEVSGQPVFDAAGEFRGYRGVATDITGRKRADDELRRLTRMYAALSSLNEAISRIRDGQELLQEACEIVASSGDFLRVAVRLLDRATGRTRFVAASGLGVEGLAALEISVAAQAAQGPSLVVEALLGGKPVITRDYQNDPRTEVARRNAAVTGARSAGAFPLRQGGECTGVLILHGSEPSSFDGDMQALLERMAENISFGLDHIAAELRDRQTFELASSGIAHVSLDGRYLRANPALCAMLGYTAAELAGRSVKEVSHPEDRDVTDAARQRLHRGEIEAVQCEKRYRRKDGSTVWAALSIALVRDSQGNPDYEITVVQDITRRTHEERLLALEHAVTRCLAESEDPGSALRKVMQLICVSESWAAGRYFALDEAAGVMRLEALWTMPGSAMAGFMEGSRPLEFRRGEGLVGLCWERCEPVWVPDVTADARVANVALARQAGVHGAFVFPVSVEGRVMGVASISSREVREPDARLLDTVRVIGAQIGQYLQRKRGDAERAALRERDRSLVSALGEIIYDWRPGADQLIWEGDFTRILGYDDMGGDTQSWTSRVHPEDAAVVQAEVDAASRERRNYDLQYRFRHRDGRYLWMHDRGVCSFDAEGRLVRIIGVLADVTARKEAEQALRGIVQASAEPLMLVRKDGTTQFVNPAAEALFGRSAKELEGAPLGLPLADGRPAEVEIVLPGGGVRPAELQFATTELEGQELLVVSLHDLSERKRYEKHIEHLANHDALTSLPNRTLLGDRVEQAIAHARRNGGHVGLMFVDLDQFKLVNDSWGHATGDTLLLEVAHRLQATVRDGDSVARLGGDEFVVLLPDLARADNTSVVARKVADALEKPLVIDGREMRITASIGIALYPDDGDSLDALLQCADAAMYRAKDAGRNGYQYYSADMGAQARARVEIEAGLRLALSRNELRLHYQPQVGLERGEVRGFEALMRWEQPARGMVSPADFIPVAEESGLIMPMGEWALLTACREAAAWSAGGFGSLRIAVNLSARQFWRGSVTEAVRKALGESGLPPSQLEIEITESVVARDLQNVMLQLEQLRRLGVSIAIDDFGTGYSSLAYLRSLPINKLKIDKSFIKGIPGDREATALVGEIIRLAHILSLEVVAEGVETEAQAGLLRQARCEAMQGYLFARPMPGPECAALLRTGRRLRFNG